MPITMFRDSLVQVGDAVVRDPLSASGSRNPWQMRRALARLPPESSFFQFRMNFAHGSWLLVIGHLIEDPDIVLEEGCQFLNSPWPAGIPACRPETFDRSERGSCCM